MAEKASEFPQMRVVVSDLQIISATGELFNHVDDNLPMWSGEGAWREKMTARDMAALNPLPHSHFNPYGVFDLDMDARLPLEDMKVAA